MKNASASIFRTFFAIKHFTLRTLLSAIGAGCLLVVALLPATGWRIALAALATGLAPMALTHRRWTPVAFACAVVVVGLPIWGFSALTAWGIRQPTLLPWLPFGISLVASVACLSIKSKLKLSGFGQSDVIALSFTGLVAIPLMAGWMVNGPTGYGSEQIFRAGPGVAGDTFYHFGLIQESLNRQAWPDENPVFAGAPNRYSALLHVSLAALASLGSGPAALLLWPVLPIYLLAGVGLLTSAIWKLARVRSRTGIIPFALFLLAAIVIRIDHFVIFQAQVLNFGLLGLLLYHTPRFAQRYISQWLMFSAILSLLVFSHTVSSFVGLILAAGICAILLVRKRWKRFIPAALCTALLCAAFVLMNSYPHQPIIEGPLPAGFLPDSLRIMVLPYALPFMICLVLAMRQKPLSGFAIATLLLVLASGFYWAGGYSASSYNKAFFALFNAPRFGVFAMLIVIPFINYRHRFERIIPWFLLAHSFILPNGPQEMIYNQLFGNSVDYRKPDIELMNRHAGDKRLAILTHGGDLALAAFSGKPLYISPVSYSAYAIDTIDERESVRRLQDQATFFGPTPPNARLAYMRANKIDTVALKLSAESNPADFLPVEAVNIIRGDEWTLFQLKPELPIEAGTSEK